MFLHSLGPSCIRNRSTTAETKKSGLAVSIFRGRWAGPLQRLQFALPPLLTGSGVGSLNAHFAVPWGCRTCSMRCPHAEAGRVRGSALPESDAVFPGGKGGAGSGQKRDCNRQWNMVISTYKLCRISPGLVKIQKAGWFRKGTRTAFCVIWGSVDFLTEDAGNASLQKSRETCKNADCRGTRQEEQTDEGDKTGRA